MTEYRPDALRGRWVHSYEEDAEDEMVLRPETYALPPSRGRTSLELHPDGSYVESVPGPVDVPERVSGRWSLRGDRLVLDAESGGSRRTWRITAAEDDRLGLRPSDEDGEGGIRTHEAG